MAATPDTPSSKTAQTGAFGNVTPPATPLSQTTMTKRKSSAQSVTSSTAASKRRGHGASGRAAKRQRLKSNRVRRSCSDSHEKNHKKLASPPANKPQGCTEQGDKPAQQPLSMVARELATDELEDQAPEEAQEYGVVQLLFRQIRGLRTQIRLLERKARDDQREMDRLRDQRNTVMAIASGQLETIDDLRRELWASKD
ncbi:hypothetical protein MAPG_04571 [Magnaporthiopsis poae ATCC 64411]|uniref:Uncharacterized protein n=1 Tax=Magnaporthiopsis poae (strain ATCC 64411 / 73-15) TaxID=644358 RepID=A0A0C4DX33_MAGP6|nr:hypothetical protein MAPG_04571 [Magnaporthiopsis poae ATCC 64411]